MCIRDRAYSFSMTDEEIEEMISEAKEEGTYEEMKEEIEADIKRAKDVYKRQGNNGKGSI